MPTIYNTNDIRVAFLSGLIYGLAGAGKTPLAATAPAPLLVTTEPGMLSLAGKGVSYVIAHDVKSSLDILAWLKSSKEAAKFGTVFYDGISAILEADLFVERHKNKDPRKYSPETQDHVMSVVSGYLTLPKESGKHMFMTCKAVETVDQITGAKTCEPFTLLGKLGPALPYHFDNVLFLRRFVERDAQGNIAKEYAAFRCRQNDYCHARNRSGMLEEWEPADISHIIRKSGGVI